MAVSRICCICNAPIEEEGSVAYLVVERFPAPLEVCERCMREANTFDGKFNIRCIRREELARLIIRKRPDRPKPQRVKLAPRTDGKFLYFTLLRPPAPGAIPAKGLVKVETFAMRTYIPAIGRWAYGSALYDRQLTNAELLDFELQAPEYAKTPEEVTGE